MTAHKILYKCKICKREGVVEAALDCSPEWIDRLIGGVCCTICYDAREKRIEAERWIFKACHLLVHAEKLKDPTAAREGAIKLLQEAVPVFCEAVCQGHRLQTVMDAGFVADFARKPENAGARMAAYKHGIADIQRTNNLADAI